MANEGELLLSATQGKYPCFNGWLGRPYVTCVHHEVCKLVAEVEKIHLHVPEHLKLSVSCDRAQFPKVPREKKTKATST